MTSYEKTDEQQEATTMTVDVDDFPWVCLFSATNNIHIFKIFMFKYSHGLVRSKGMLLEGAQ
jgi:hypothetical protein